MYFRFPYFSTIKSLMQCINLRLVASECFMKHKDGKKILWKCCDRKTEREIVLSKKSLKSEQILVSSVFLIKNLSVANNQVGISVQKLSNWKFKQSLYWKVVLPLPIYSSLQFLQTLQFGRSDFGINKSIRSTNDTFCCVLENNENILNRLYSVMFNFCFNRAVWVKSRHLCFEIDSYICKWTV